ncbi:hypothetical protein HDE78_002343 [Rhodanobacter sp. K2T2]|uniref:DUF6795 domain-containing protein n=1 Tax=Rhodanobacter sp. K2T2 TaxID=2723085 RepID=UPI0015C80A9C|nr:DUF6795 domain-containing protein [Rhodanobacter sp. K2T2]NYE29385.1 hypothetical protein [Rhodanobacter sp. K2T2]
MTSSSRILLCVLAAAGVVGCSVPIKHRYLIAPQISGTVTRAGQPVQGMHMQLVDVLNASGEPQPGAQTQEAVTDAQGHFTLGPIKQQARRIDNPLFKVDQHTVPWGLRMSQDGQTWNVGWVSDPDMLGEVPNAVVTAQCDLAADSKSSVIEGDIAVVGIGPCKLKVAVASKK